MSKIEYQNHSHQVIVEALHNAGVQVKNPIMLTATQYDNEYCVSTGYMSTGVHIPKSAVNEEEIQSIPEELGYRFVLNKVWHQKD